MDTVPGWAKERNLTLFADPANPRIITFYVSKGHETLQIVLENMGNSFRVDIWSVETEDDEEFHYVTVIDSSRLHDELDKLLKRVNGWFSTRNF